MRITKTPGQPGGFDRKYTIELSGLENANFERILEGWLDALEFHEMKSRDYEARDEGYNLGLRGEFVGLSRKFQKLKRVVWDGKDPLFEGCQEILMDLMGQVGLAILEQRQVKDKYSAGWRDNHGNKPTFGPGPYPSPEKAIPEADGDAAFNTRFWGDTRKHVNRRDGSCDLHDDCKTGLGHPGA